MSHEPVFDANGWAPIESAPRNYGEFLAWEQGCYFACRWGESMTSGPGFWDRDSELRNPTHWKPLGPGPVGA